MEAPERDAGSCNQGRLFIIFSGTTVMAFPATNQVFSQGSQENTVSLPVEHIQAPPFHQTFFKGQPKALGAVQISLGLVQILVGTVLLYTFAAYTSITAYCFIVYWGGAWATAPAQAYFVCPVKGRAKYCREQALGLSDLSRCLRNAVLCSALNRADKVRFCRSRSMKTRRVRHLMKIGGAGPDQQRERPWYIISGSVTVAAAEKTSRSLVKGTLGTNVISSLIALCEVSLVIVDLARTYYYRYGPCFPNPCSLFQNTILIIRLITLIHLLLITFLQFSMSASAVAFSIRSLKQKTPTVPQVWYLSVAMFSHTYSVPCCLANDYYVLQYVHHPGIIYENKGYYVIRDRAIHNKTGCYPNSL
ncbi:unnamed protein product [Ranitomeya imitator]|uniref:Uncharacterized protein n=1 Tax=Ranitomeya imitator TaxID=111125 RepID=A0ABN9MID5_9NEOB|nr:unnamed protein product [Ranitomeya imitator]